MSTRDSSTNPDEGEDKVVSKERDGTRDKDAEKGERGDRGGHRQRSSTNAASKTKDLSHVPCKFYKVGGCTAGASCPFSHALVEPGGQKETCAWFVKGNCKFGHKCALAHILPGQSMAMDRKNKKAAQVAAAGHSDRSERSERGRDGKGGRGGSNAKRDGHGANAVGSGTGTPSNRNPLLSGGSTAPTRVPVSPNPASRPPMTMPLKATLSPSAPAPPLASFGIPDDLDDAGVQLATAPAQGKQSSQDSTPSNSAPNQEYDQKPRSNSSPGPLPLSAPRPTAISTKAQPDFGPIGSPPTSGSYKANGTTAFSPGSSPQAINGIDVVAGTPPNTANRKNNFDFLSTSPFSAPGRQSVWPSGGSYNGGSGITASLGSGIAMMGGRKGWGSNGGSGSVGAGGLGGMMPQRRAPGIGYDIGMEYDDYAASSKGKTSGLGSTKGSGRFGKDIAVEDEDLEDFLPSSLTDLLTPEERSRRMSRSNSGQGPGVTNGGGFGAGELGSGTGTGAGSGLGIGHRYSRSVPAPTLLGDIRSIWADTNVPPLPSPSHRPTPSSSFVSRFDPGAGAGTGHVGDESSSSVGIGSAGMNSLSPSNASAAFLPGLHQHYLSSKQTQQQLGLGLGLGRGVGIRGTSGPLFTSTAGTNDSATNYLLGSNTLSSTNTSHNPHLPPQHMYRTTPSPFDLTQQQHHHHLHPQPPHTSLAIPSPGGSGTNTPSLKPDDPHHGTHLLSPSARALQAHAPGQSLPQGLAAGYSRIHALPPPPSLASPGSASIFGGGTPPADAHAPSSGPYGGWKSAGSPPPTGGSGATGNPSGLESMFSRLSYSAATAARGQGNYGTNNGISNGTGSGINNGSNMSPPGLQRNASGGRYQQHPLSPLSGPVVTPDDDDELFSMDG